MNKLNILGIFISVSKFLASETNMCLIVLLFAVHTSIKINAIFRIQKKFRLDKVWYMFRR